MSIDWNTLFTQADPSWKDAWNVEEPLSLPSLERLKHFLDLAQIKYCLVKPFREFSDYPLVETRELLPSFEADLWEHKQLPGFSLVAFARPINYFTEIFQFELLKPIGEHLRTDHAQSRMIRNKGVFQSRLPRSLHEPFRSHIQKTDVTLMSNYPKLIPFLMNMDRAQVFGMHGPNPQHQNFYLAGIYASLPSDLDTEIKRYGQRIGKFHFDDPDSYENNRAFVFQYLMELYGFPVASERRTSAAIFARRLHKMGERFLVRTLSQSDRTITTLWCTDPQQHSVAVEKIALVSVDEDQDETFALLKEGGYLLDRKKRVVILRVRYRQHKYSPDNVREERALSVLGHEVIHPLTGEALSGVSIIRDTTNMFLRLNDIVQGEHIGRIVYKRNEIVENTDTEEKRLKFLYAWLSKHQRRIIGYSDEFFANIDKILDTYLLSPENFERFASVHELYHEVVNRYSYIHQARKIRLLEDLLERKVRGSRISYKDMLAESVSVMHALKFEIVSYFDSLVATVIAIGESMLNDRYLVRTYIEKPEESLTPNGLEIRKNYGKLVALIDDFRSIRKTRTEINQRLTAS